MAASSLPTCSNTHKNSTARIVKCAAAIVANNKANANKDNQLAVVVAPTMAEVVMNSTKAMVGVGDTIRLVA